MIRVEKKKKGFFKKNWIRNLNKKEFNWTKTKIKIE